MRGNNKIGMMLQNYVLETFRKPNTVHHPILENILCSTVSVIFLLILVSRYVA